MLSNELSEDARELLECVKSEAEEKPENDPYYWVLFGMSEMLKRRGFNLNDHEHIPRDAMMEIVGRVANQR